MKNGIVTTLVLSALAASASAEQVHVDFGSPIRPLTHAGTGFLHSMSETAPANSLITPLQPQLLRVEPGTGPFNTYDRGIALGVASYQLVVSDATNYVSPWPGDNNNWTSWENTAKSFAQQALSQHKEVMFDVWNEPDVTGEFWGRSKSQWLETWRHGVNAIRSVDPTATIVGPSLSSYNNSFLGMQEFLTFAKANNVLPDVISWHSFGSYITGEVNDLKSIGASLGVDVSRISINETLAEEEAYLPGSIPDYLSEIENNRIESSARSCWGTCFNNSLDGLLTTSNQPRSTWWVYERYGRMSGQSVATTGATSLNVVASKDTGLAYALVGRFDQVSSTAQVSLENLGDVQYLLQQGKVHVLAERIVNSGTAASAGPTVTINADYTVTNGRLLLTLPNFGSSYDAYAIALSPLLPGDFNGDGIINAADYAVWRKGGGTAAAYATWRANFGKSMGASGTSLVESVPEPATAVLLSLSVAIVAARCRRWQKYGGRQSAIDQNPPNNRGE